VVVSVVRSQQEVLREAACRAVGVEGCQDTRESARWAVAEAVGHVLDGLAGEGALSAVRVSDVEEPGSAPVSAVIADADGAGDAVRCEIAQGHSPTQAPAQFVRRPHGSSGSRSPGHDTLELVQDVLAS
jgi:hypothetical protein